MPREISEQKRELILKLKNQGETIATIAEVSGVSAATVSRHLKQNGLSRGTYVYGKSKMPKEYCKQCHNRNPRGSSYCNACGKILLSDAQILVEEIKTLFKLEPSLPEGFKEPHHDTLLKAINYIERTERQNAKN